MLDLRMAVAEDAAVILGLRHAAEDWLAARSIDQWRPREVPLSTIEGQVAAGEFFVAREQSGAIVGAVRLLWSDPAIWGDDGVAAAYVHGLVIDRAYAGLGVGRGILDWALRQAGAAKATVLRLDCAETNHELREYYLRSGFTEVGRRDFDDQWFSVALFEKRIDSQW